MHRQGLTVGMNEVDSIRSRLVGARRRHEQAQWQARLGAAEAEEAAATASLQRLAAEAETVAAAATERS